MHVIFLIFCCSEVRGYIYDYILVGILIDEVSEKIGFAGDSVTLQLIGIDIQKVHVGKCYSIKYINFTCLQTLNLLLIIMLKINDSFFV